MERKSYETAAAFENRFWLQILGDHARFILNALTPKETASIRKANDFKKTFDELLNRARKQLSNDQWLQLSREAEKQANNIRNFKLNIIERQLKGTIDIHFTPTFMNHMVNEVEEYIRVLNDLTAGKVPPVYHELHHHQLWLADAAGHAGAINDTMDAVERGIKDKSNEYRILFENFWVKAVEMAGYLRTGLKEFPALKRFNRQVDVELALFKSFLRELEELELSVEVLSSFTPLMADHMAREECYYLLKLAEASGIELPDCDPTKPRVTD
ncbi:DUF2935 domain-containing protein [Alkalihalobacillus sp. AL-G]|uniref:DUF2935 domain-containing protein n=1 Tax=Alkalihalobacillus sp. AL-G TaxID=2926399 RepID=UPI00272CD350|nr:DUF2935 domain-containing protein [Alkalihalobacillus sp. AL-G]WLD93935.1 DUF2935 domain-containing protein [Alkalihalobacillus sp. AL-G]